MSSRANVLDCCGDESELVGVRRELTELDTRERLGARGEHLVERDHPVARGHGDGPAAGSSQVTARSP